MKISGVRAVKHSPRQTYVLELTGMPCKGHSPLANRKQARFPVFYILCSIRLNHFGIAILVGSMRARTGILLSYPCYSFSISVIDKWSSILLES